MPEFKRLLQTHYSEYRELDIARILELPDIYQPQLGVRPRAYVGLCHEPTNDQIVTGLSGKPRRREGEIFEDVDKIVPDRNLEKFIDHTIRDVQNRIEEEADRHTITADVRELLESDPDFRLETTKSLPKGIHPNYTDRDAELWQKPASKVEYVDGSQGFLQIWRPVDEDGITLVDATAGEYDREEIVDAIREKFETTVE